MTREECDCLEINGISTHTPAWGVTVQFAYDHIELYISTHTPAWGVTP